MKLLETMGDAIKNGRVPSRIFNDPEIWELEKTKLFGKVWSFLGHESEIPQPGDYVTRYIADNNIILARDEHGEIKANLNMCRHRGNQICKAEMGNSSHFRCSYHGWVYKNSGELVGVPFLKESYDGLLNRGNFGLVSIRVDSYEGLIFGTLDKDAPTLEEYLGGFQFYLDIYLKPGPNGVEVYGPPDRWAAETDWKICAENFSGDGYHTPVAHQFGFALGYFPSSGTTHNLGWAVHIPDKGHAIGLGHTPGLPPFVGYPDALVQHMKHTLSEGQQELFAKTRTAVGTVFPNLSFLIQPFSPIPEEKASTVRFCTMRLWHPTGAGKMEMYSWCLVPRDAEPEYKERAYEAYTLAFGQAGTFEQDDFENWTNLTRQVGTSLGSTLEFPYQMGMDLTPVTDFPGPGVAVDRYVTENNFRNQWATWLSYVGAELCPP